MRVVRRGPLSNSDYAALTRPTVQRQRAVGDGLAAEAEVRTCWIFQHSCGAKPTDSG